MTDSSPAKPPEPAGDEPRSSTLEAAPDALREQLYVIIFEAETPAGRAFDVAVLIIIFGSVLAVCLESVTSFESRFGTLLRTLEWIFTVVFSIEYAARIYCARHRLRYVFSFFGIVDLLSLLPTFLSLIFTGAQSLLVIRALRLLRMFRVLKIMRHLGEAHSLMMAIRSSIPKISVFLGAVLIIAVIVGALMYVIEEPESGFTSVPRSMYWAIVTMTTVGYGDIAPKTVLGQGVAAILMIIGYGIIAVPTGIVSAEFVGNKGGGEGQDEPDDHCHHCGTAHHPADANFCRVCGSALQ